MTAIKSIGVLGAGKMGESIAQRVVEEGFKVVLVDIKPELIERAQESIQNKLAAKKQNAIKGESPEDVLARLKITTDPALLKNVSMVFEAIPEDWETKKSSLANIAKICGDKTIFATSATSWSITSLAKSVPNPKRFVGMHFFWKAPRIPVFEIVGGKETSKETIEKCRKVSRMLGCLTTICSDAPGFLVKRVQSAIVNESIRLLSEGRSNIPTLDAAAKVALGTKTGPFESMNQLGINVAKQRVDGLAELGNIYAVPQRFNVQATSQELWKLEGDIDKDAIDGAVDVLRGVAIQVACEILNDKIATIEDIDLAVEFGLGWNKGPFELSNLLGMEKSLELASAVEAARETSVPAVLKEAAASNKQWSLNYVDLHVHDGIATIKINRPNASNALNEKVIDQFNQILNKIEGESTIKAIVFAGTGKLLACGLEPDSIAKNIKSDTTADTVKLFKKAHKLLGRISSIEKMTVTCANGPTIGGGVELGLASKFFVAGPRATFAFPETGWGIHPGFGGTQRLPRKVGKSIGKYVILTGEELSAGAAHRLGIVDALADDEDGIEQIISELANGEDLLADDGIPTDEELAKISLFNPKNCRSTLSGDANGDSTEAKNVASSLSSKGPIALKLADKLIEDGFSLELEKSLNWELASLELILGTKDALKGLESVGGKPATFSGE